MGIMNEVHIVVDIETLGVSPGCGIWDIGAVVVVPAEPSTTDPDRFGMTADPSTTGLDIDSATVSWQMFKNKNNYELAKLSANTESGILIEFLNWLNVIRQEYPGKKVTFWSQGHFDFPILEAAFKAYGWQVPWKFWECMDLRTVEYWYGKKLPKDSDSHSAIVDAVRESEMLINLMKFIGN